MLMFGTFVMFECWNICIVNIDYVGFLSMKFALDVFYKPLSRKRLISFLFIVKMLYIVPKDISLNMSNCCQWR